MKSLLTAVLVLLGAVASAEEAARFDVATVDIDRVVNAIGYENLAVLSADSRTKELLAGLNREMAELYGAILDTEDGAAGRELQQRYSALEQKLAWIKSQAARRGCRDYRETVAQFVRLRYGARHPVIVVRNQFNAAAFVQWNVRETDITHEVIEAFRMELGSDSGRS